MEKLDRMEKLALRRLLLMATAPDRMAGMRLDPGGEEFRVAMKICDILAAEIKASAPKP